MELRLFCHSCYREWREDTLRVKCMCGGLLGLEVKAKIDINNISQRKPSLWRYREVIPILDDASIISLDEGYTPLTSIELYAEKVFLKQDYLFPTGSFKDRGSTVLISKARELRVGGIIEDSSGNAGASIAAYSVRAGIKCTIYVPASASPSKLNQILIYGANLIKVDGSREAAANLALHSVKKAISHGKSMLYASHVYNPYFLHGIKTFSYEVCEQLGWKAPDAVILPVGNGSLLLGVYIGFKELVHTGIIPCLPRIIAVQTEAVSPIFLLFRDGSYPEAKAFTSTLAEGIAIANPLRIYQIVDAVRESRGYVITVTEEEIKEALLMLCKRGLFIEPTSAVAIAGLKQYLEHAGDEVIVTSLTGTGLKASEAIRGLLKKGEKGD